MLNPISTPPPCFQRAEMYLCRKSFCFNLQPLIYLTADRILVLFFKKKNISPRQAIERNQNLLQRISNAVGLSPDGGHSTVVDARIKHFYGVE
jgi:hypothetical protein